MDIVIIGERKQWQETLPVYFRGSFVREVASELHPGQACYNKLYVIFPYRLLQNIEYSSLCYTVGPCWLSTLYIIVSICYPSHNPPFPLGKPKFVCYVCESVSVL